MTVESVGRSIRSPANIVAIAIVLIGSLAGCASLPSQESRQPSTHMTNTADTILGRGIQAASEAHPGKSGVFPLAAPLDAFAARVLLMRAAQRSLDIQYYIWHADTTGTLMLEEVKRAAQRGVRVRLLLDDNGIAGLDPDLAALEAYANIEVRLFNPFLQRSIKSLGYLTDFQRLNHRMHNKSLTADTQATIVGGRNIGDAYFGADPVLDFSDLDVLAVGRIAIDVAHAFDEYWNSASAYPSASIIGAPPSHAAEALDDRFAAVRASAEAQAYGTAVRQAQFVDQLLAGRLALEWVPVRLVYDSPTKAQGAVPDADLLLAQIAQALGPAQSELDLVSPYFVPGKIGTAALSRYPAQGVRLRIVTNSLAATDVAAVHAGYAKRREALLRAGVRLYELKPDARVTQHASSGTPGSSAASLHGKTFAVDRERVFVGSFNIDPRSVRINTEMGLVIESRTLATALSDVLDRQLATLAYEVRLSADGSLEWVEHTDAGEVRHRSEPGAGLGRRIGVKLLSWLPIDWLL